MEQTGAKIVRPLTLKYALALGLLAALAAANFWILRTAIRESAGLAAIVNQAGRQRMLLLRTAILAERLVFSFLDADRPRIRSELLSDLESLEKTHAELMSPQTHRRVGIDEDVRIIYEDAPWSLHAEMSRYVRHIRSMIHAAPEELTYQNADFAHIRDPATLDRIRNGLEAVVGIYEARSDAKTAQLNLLAFWSFASTLALLLFDGWFVFRPMVRQVRGDIAELDNLNATLEERIADRTAEAEHRAEQLATSEAALRESESLYSSLVHHMPMSVLQKNSEGEFTFANQRFCQLVGKPLDQVVGRTDADFYSAEMFDKYRQDDHRVMETETVFQGVEEHVTPDGREQFVEVLKAPLRDAGGNVVGTQTMFWDVTDRQQAEQRAMQAERLAAIGQMVTGVAHESRNALQKIQACSQLLMWDLEGDEKKQSLLAELQRAEQRLLRLFEELRGYAAPRKLDRRPCDIRDVVAEAWAAVRLQLKERHTSLCERHNQQPTQCVADPFQLEQVFRNLFENAVAACDDPVKVEVDYQSVEYNDQTALRITVADNGPGLSAEQQARIFEPFYTTKTQGTGLGMAIVRRIVEAHGGRVRAESNGDGAVMIVTLPCQAAPPIGEARDPESVKTNLERQP